MAGRAGLRSIVLGVDGSPHSRRAAAFVARLAPPTGGRVTVVSVVEPIRPPSMALLPASIRGRLAGAAAELERARLNAGRRWAEAGISGSNVRAGALGRYRAATNSSISALTSSGRSVGGKCPAPESST